jgi:serine protease Do
MIVKNWGALAAALTLAGLTAPAPVAAQDREPLARAFEIIGRGAQIGVSVSDIAADDAKQKAGVIVDTVSPDSPADKAGIKAGDAITEFDGERVRSVRQFTRLVQETNAGRAVPVTLSRGGQRVTVNVTPEQRGDRFTRLLEVPGFYREPTPVPPRPPSAPRAIIPDMRVPGMMRLFGNGRLGLTIESLDDQLAEYFGVKEGVLVKSVQADSVAAKAGLKAGDVITAFDGRKIYETSDLTRAIERVGTSGEFTVEVMRDKKAQTLKGKLEPRESRETTRVRTRTIL